MLIDWFTVGAQALNFIILVWLMRRFLYKPVLNAIDAREKKVAGELAAAAAKEAEAEKQRDEFQHKNEEFEQSRAAMLKAATEAADAERHRLLDEARKAAEALSIKRRETLRNEAQNLNQAIRRRVQQEVFAVARKALADLSTTTLEERMVEVFFRRFGGMAGQAKATLADAIKKASEPLIVSSAFELPAAQRATIQDGLNRAFSADLHIRFETAPDLVGGISLATDGHKVGWSIADYLGSLEKGIVELLKEKGTAEANSDAKASRPEAKPDAQPAPKPHETAEPVSEVSPKSKPAERPAASSP